jgi:hypothetical protein
MAREADWVSWVGSCRAAKDVKALWGAANLMGISRLDMRKVSGRQESRDGPR